MAGVDCLASSSESKRHHLDFVAIENGIPVVEHLADLPIVLPWHLPQKSDQADRTIRDIQGNGDIYVLPVKLPGVPPACHQSRILGYM